MCVIFHFVQNSLDLGGGIGMYVDSSIFFLTLATASKDSRCHTRFNRA
jgi:hypothetical protein